MLVKNVRRRLSRPRGAGGISQAKTGSSAKASASTSPSRAASSRRAARTAWEPPRADTVSWVTGLLLPPGQVLAGRRRSPRQGLFSVLLHRTGTNPGRSFIYRRYRCRGMRAIGHAQPARPKYRRLSRRKGPRRSTMVEVSYAQQSDGFRDAAGTTSTRSARSEEHTSELQSPVHI